MEDENKKKYLEQFREFIEDFYDYTTDISITEFELFSHYEFLGNEAKYDDYKNQALKDIMFDFLFNPKAIEFQLANDLETFGDESQEFPYIQEMYYKCKNIINIYIEDLEKEGA